MNVYFISGLGADRRAFERIKLSDNYVVHYLDWIPPVKNESLNEYARRLSASIDTSQPFALVGLSMGGMIASSLNSFLKPHKTVLISSIGCNKEFPPLLKTGRFIRFNKLVPQLLFSKPAMMFGRWFMGSKTKAEKKMMNYFVSKADPWFMKWAIGAILTWQDCDRPQSLFQIQGSKDRMLPMKYTKPDVIIKGGTHFMVWVKAGEVSKVLQQALDS